MMKQKTLIITAGLPGVGKSYAMRMLMGILKEKGFYVHWFDSDAFGKKFKKKHPKFDQMTREEQIKVRLQSHQEKVIQIQRKFDNNSLFTSKKPKIILLDTCFDLPDSREYFYKLGRKKDYDLWIIEIRCPDKVAWKHIVQSEYGGRQMGDKKSRWKLYNDMKSWWRPIRWPQHVIINSNEDVERQLRIFVKTYLSLNK